MATFYDLYHRLCEASLDGDLTAQAKEIRKQGTPREKGWARCLLHPEKQQAVIQTRPCQCGEGEGACEAACLFDAIKRDKNGKLVISGACAGCGQCIEACPEHALEERRDLVPLIDLLRKRKIPVYAMIAPAFSGQFRPEVTSGRLRSAFKTLGFYGMVEVALFADILTLKEALEFDRAIKTDRDFVLTSCCCPIWMALIRKSYSSLVPHVPPSVSPMVACGRSIKRIHPEAVTVFIGPCIAKKAEAKEPDIADAVDYVLTFQEVNELFDRMKVDPAVLPEDYRDHSSRAGRIYARTGGVSEAVRSTLARIAPGRKIPLRAVQADGVPDCRKLLTQIAKGDICANFIEGMGCRGGCVGGPKSLIPAQQAREHVNQYGGQSAYETPIDNRYVIETLHRLGFDTVESLLDRDNTFMRKF